MTRKTTISATIITTDIFHAQTEPFDSLDYPYMPVSTTNMYFVTKNMKLVIQAFFADNLLFKVFPVFYVLLFAFLLFPRNEMKSQYHLS